MRNTPEYLCGHYESLFDALRVILRGGANDHASQLQLMRTLLGVDRPTVGVNKVSKWLDIDKAETSPPQPPIATDGSHTEPESREWVGRPT
jgi:hypothetical protein